MRRICCLLLLAVLLFSPCLCRADEEVIPPQWPVPDYVVRLLEAACAFTNNMATFDEASIDDGYLDEIREKDCYTV